jgi:endonuclease VIII
MPEGDTIFRAARTLHRALAGRMVTRFESVFPHLTRVDEDSPLRGRVVEGVESRGKHLLIQLSGRLALRTHMRMHGSWHIYRPGERWQRPRHDMRIVLATAEFEAVAFSVPVAEFLSTDDLARQRDLREMGPDLLGDTFNPADAVTRIAQRPEIAIADALLEQRAIAGIGNVYKSEVLFACRVNPFTLVRDLEPGAIERLVTTAEKLLRANIEDATGGGIVTYAGGRRTTGRADPSARLWVYGRAGKPCRRCGTPVSRAKQGPHARSTYWCSRCQLPTPNTRSEPTPNP